MVVRAHFFHEKKGGGFVRSEGGARVSRFSRAEMGRGWVCGAVSVRSSRLESSRGSGGHAGLHPRGRRTSRSTSALCRPASVKRSLAANNRRGWTGTDMSRSISVSSPNLRTWRATAGETPPWRRT